MNQPNTNPKVHKQLAQARAAHEQGKFARAKELYRSVLKADSNNHSALQYLGILYGQTGRFEDALHIFAKACTAYPNDSSMYYNRGKALQELRRHAEAVTNFDKAIKLNPNFANAHNNRGVALSELRRHDESLSSYDMALMLRPDFAEAHVNRGKALLDLHRRLDALASFDRALSINGALAEAHNNRGQTLLALQRTDEALISCDRAIALRPDFANAYRSRGEILFSMMRFDEAIASYDRSLELDPKQPFIRGKRLHALLTSGRWNDFEHSVDTIVNLVERGFPASAPFELLATPASARTLKKLAILCAADRYPESRPPFRAKDRQPHERIRVGYFSADFHHHATMYLMAELFEKHDRTGFEFFAFSFGPTVQDEMRQRAVNAFEHFFDVHDQSDDAVATLARQHEIDIAIDLKGATHDFRPGIFAARPAPIQVSYLGFPGTMGTTYIDYIIADPVIIPATHYDDYTEKVVQLPHSYQPNDAQRVIAQSTPSRQALGLPESGFVFCCFNNNYKITPDLFTIWMRLLTQIDGSVLWLLEGNSSIGRNLRLEAEQRGIAPERLIFCSRISLAEHLARHRQADLFLDTFYYNAHTTTSDALWAGLPVLTCLGETFSSRVAASLLQAIGMPELITRNHTEYEELALRFARDPSALAAVREKLASNRLTHPLFNTELYARHLEAAYSAMWQRHQQGLAPEHLVVPA